jgi:DNA helicase-2/ATP-dependent DNA helicase PcrA
MPNRDYQLQKYQEIYLSLNPEQKLAVDSIEGPVMVIAGPGTGKTQILGARIGKILLETDTLAENILCLTYTDAGALAMRRRLGDFIGPDAYRVNIYTFHAFCHEMIQQNLSQFEKTELEPVSKLEQTRFLTRLIDDFPPEHPLKRFRGEAYYDLKNLRKLFEGIKREGITPAYINVSIDKYLEDLPNREAFIYKRKSGTAQAGDLKMNDLLAEKEKMEKLRAAVHEFDKFQQIMRAHDRYDFEDMINWVLRVFDENEPLLRRYQEQYLYILVDEYQDTSGSQNRLVEQLISYWDKPNVFVVGDDDQSIYRFQGANLKNMLDFARTYPRDLLTVVLTKNYRSTQPILDMAKTLISRNRERLVNQMPGISKELVSVKSDTGTGSLQPLILEYETARHEMGGIALRIQQLIGEKVSPGNIAVIYRENQFGSELAQYCKALGIPFYSKRQENILEIPLARKIVLLLRFLATEHDISYSGDEMLFEILHFDWFHIPPVEIARLSVEVASRQFGEQKISLRQLLAEKAASPPPDLFSPGMREELRVASRVLEELIGSVPNLTLQQLFDQCLREAGILSAILQDPDKGWLMEVLTGLFDFIREETRRNPLLGLRDLVGTLELMQAEHIELPLVRVEGSEKGVNLLTAHGSKGLEFEYLFIAGCNASLWESKRQPNDAFTLPDTVMGSPAGSKQDQDRIREEELRRLFYVAITRAERSLSISYSRYKQDGKEMEPSMFIAEILEVHELPFEKVFFDAGQMTAFRALLFAETAPELEKLEEVFVSRLLEKFVMNVTALNNYLRCPLEFYFRNLLRIPSPKNEATEFGSAVHFALEQLFSKMQNNQDRFPGREVLLSDFEYYMRRHRESFTREQFDRKLAYGKRVLPDYYDKYVGTWNRIVAVERSIRNVVVKGVPIKGKLDKLEFDGRMVNVVDYKTGDPVKGKKRLNPPSDKDPKGGDYWRQAVFYKILVDHTDRRWQATSTEFDFIEPDKKKEFHKYRLEVRDSDLETVSRQITDTWEKIQQHQFYTGCGKSDCHWCNFAKTNQLAIALHELTEEEA